MFPVRMVLCQLEGTPQYRECEVQDLFAEDMNLLGGKYRGSMVMTAGPIGTGAYFQYYFDPRSALTLALLVEYAEDCHHGFVAIVMRNPEKSHLLPTPLSLGENGHWLDSLPPPSVHPLGRDPDADFEWQMEMVEDWNRSKEYIEQLELENRLLRSRLT